MSKMKMKFSKYLIIAYESMKEIQNKLKKFFSKNRVNA